MPVIKQPSQYINLAVDHYRYYEPYDHTLIQCDGNGEGCNRLCEKGVGLCDPCIDKMVDEMVGDSNAK